MEAPEISSVECTKDSAAITICGMPDSGAEAYQILGPVSSHGLNVDLIVQSRSRGRSTITFTLPRGDYEKALDVLRETVAHHPGATLRGDKRLAKVSVRGRGLRSHATLAKTLFQVLATQNVSMKLISTSELSTAVLVEESAADVAATALSEVFGCGSQAARDAA
jgi:aspartate kinase